MSPLWPAAPDVSPDVITRMRGLKNLVGNTPLLAIAYTWRGEPRVLYAKCEMQNLTGSIKDRLALHVIRRAYESGVLRRGAPIVAASTGNSGISFAAIGRAIGHPVTVVMPHSTPRERIDLVRSFGADVSLALDTGAGIRDCARLAESVAAPLEGALLAHDFARSCNAEAHARTTGPELWSQLFSHALKPDAFVAGVGTGGTLMGVGRYLRAMHPSIRLHPLEPRNAPVLSSPRAAGPHRIAGLADVGQSMLADLKHLDEILSVDDGDAIRMAQALARVLGLPVGISSGANFLGAVQAQTRWGKDSVVATVFPDSSRNYLCAPLTEEEPAEEGHLTSEIRLLAFRAQNRTCEACADMDAF